VPSGSRISCLVVCRLIACKPVDLGRLVEIKVVH
jgi:hypothetical protein